MGGIGVEILRRDGLWNAILIAPGPGPGNIMKENKGPMIRMSQDLSQFVLHGVVIVIPVYEIDIVR
jgi:hypothetical protein